MSAAVTSSMTWCALRPLMAANMLRIMGASLPFLLLASSDARSGRGLDVLVVSLSCLACLPCRLGDDSRVDVREDVVLHVVAVDRRDDGAVLDGHHECRGVH